MDLPISQYKAMYIVTYRTYSHHYDYYHYPEIKYIVYYIFDWLVLKRNLFQYFVKPVKLFCSPNLYDINDNYDDVTTVDFD